MGRKGRNRNRGQPNLSKSQPTKTPSGGVVNGKGVSVENGGKEFESVANGKIGVTKGDERNQQRVGVTSNGSLGVGYGAVASDVINGNVTPLSTEETQRIAETATIENTSNGTDVTSEKGEKPPFKPERSTKKVLTVTNATNSTRLSPVNGSLKTGGKDFEARGDTDWAKMSLKDPPNKKAKKGPTVAGKAKRPDVILLEEPVDYTTKITEWNVHHKDGTLSPRSKQPLSPVSPPPRDVLSPERDDDAMEIHVGMDAESVAKGNRSKVLPKSKFQLDDIGKLIAEGGLGVEEDDESEGEINHNQNGSTDLASGENQATAKILSSKGTPFASKPNQQGVNTKTIVTKNVNNTETVTMKNNLTKEDEENIKQIIRKESNKQDYRPIFTVKQNFHNIDEIPNKEQHTNEEKQKNQKNFGNKVQQGLAAGALYGMEASAFGQELKEHCVKALTDIGAPDDFTKFFGDILQLETDMNDYIYKLHQRITKKDTDIKQPAVLLKKIQELTKTYNYWKSTIDTLAQRGEKVSQLEIDSKKITDQQVLKALCSLRTKEVDLIEGDEITITDTSVPNRLKVKNSKGEEGYIPALCCLLPQPDRTALTAVERLKIHLLASWTETAKRLRSLLAEALQISVENLKQEWADLRCSEVNKERVHRRCKRLTEILQKNPKEWDLNKLHNAFFSLEKELTSLESNSIDLKPMVERVAVMDKTVLCFQMYLKQWYIYRKSQEKQARPIRIVDNWSKIKPSKNGRSLKYFEVKMTCEETETVEEITYIHNDNQSDCMSETWSSEGGGKLERVETNQITHQNVEEKRRFIIKAVVHPKTKEFISIQDAVKLGIVDQQNGLYVTDLHTGDGMPIPQAMNQGLIRVECSTATKVKEETHAIGLITIQTQIDNRPYHIVQVIDAMTGERVDLDEAIERNIMDVENGNFIHRDSGEVIALDLAIHSGWVIVEYEEEGEPLFEEKTFAVSAVVDARKKRKIPFEEGVRLGLIEKDTGNYVNNLTGERIYVAEAIKRGFLKAKQVESTAGLDVDAENKVVIQNVDKIRKNVLKSAGVLSAFKRAAAAHHNNNS